MKNLFFLFSVLIILITGCQTTPPLMMQMSEKAPSAPAYLSPAKNTSVPLNMPTCSKMKASKKSCFSEFEGAQRGRCEVCREGKRCFFALDGIERSRCEAYVEGKSCFFAFNDGEDRKICEGLKESKAPTTDLDQYLLEIDSPRTKAQLLHMFWSN